MNVAALLPVIVRPLLNVKARTAMESEALAVIVVLAAAEVLLRKCSLIVADLDPLLLLVKKKAISGKIHTLFYYFQQQLFGMFQARLCWG
jgi:hypothetical protein